MKNKIIAIALALTTVMSVAPFAGAATTDDLQAQINQLSEKINQILQMLTVQGTTTITTPAVSASNCFTKTLQKGMTDEEVKTLQTALKSDSSIYPEGLVTGYFGSLTEAAVKKFQAKYGIDQTGTVGPVTRAKLNSLYCNVTPTTSPTGSVTPTTSPTTTGVPSYGTLSVKSNPVSQSDTTLEAGKTYELVAAQYKATGSDITIKKIAVETTATNVFPWQIFSTISLWDGSTKLAEVAINSANLIENSFATKYTLNIAGLNIVVPNGQNKVLTVKGTTLSYLTSNAQGKSITVVLPKGGIVYTDTAGIVYTSIDNDVTRNLGTSSDEANEATVKLTLAADNPKAGAVVGSKGSSSKVDLVKFNTKVEDVGFTMNKMDVVIEADNTTTTLTAIELHDASGLIASASVTWGTVATTSVTLDNFTLPIAAETTKTFTIKGVLASLSDDYDGTEAYKVNSVTVTGVDANNNLPNITGDLSGNYQHVYLVAPQFTLVSNPTPVKNDDGTEADTTLSFDVKALGGDIYFSTSANDFITAFVVNASTTASSTFVMDVTGYTEKGTNYYRVAENSTTRVTLSIHLIGNGGYAQYKIDSLSWGTSSTSLTSSTTTYGLDDFKTPSIYLSK